MREFAMASLREAVGTMEPRTLKREAARWREQDVITDEDVAEIEAMIADAEVVKRKILAKKDCYNGTYDLSRYVLDYMEEGTLKEADVLEIKAALMPDTNREIKDKATDTKVVKAEAVKTDEVESKTVKAEAVKTDKVKTEAVEAETVENEAAEDVTAKK